MAPILCNAKVCGLRASCTRHNFTHSLKTLKIKTVTFTSSIVYGHTTLKAPVLVRSPKLSNVGPYQQFFLRAQFSGDNTLRGEQAEDNEICIPYYFQTFSARCTFSGSAHLPALCDGGLHEHRKRRHNNRTDAGTW